MKRELTTATKDESSRKRTHPDLPPGTLRYLGTSLKQQWKRYRKGLKRCQQKFSEKAVHQSRVETRRLLSILALLSPFLARGRFQKVHVCLKQHLDTFDDLRDTQVQLAAVTKMLRAFPAATPFYEYLNKREARLSRTTRKDVKRIKTKRLGKLIVQCRDDVKNWATHAGPGRANRTLLSSIDAAFRRTVELRNRIDPRIPDTIHRTRIAFKRLRYMVETLADYLPMANEKLLDAMHRYQTMMGDIQDAEVLRSCLDHFLEKKRIGQSVADQLRRELLARRQFLIRVYLDAADQLLDFWHDAPTRSGAKHAPISRSLRMVRLRAPRTKPTIAPEPGSD